MKTKTATFQASDKKEIFYHRWLPDERGRTRGVLQIAHGMAEYGVRYTRFAERLTQQGIAVYANDHRGHGMTAESVDKVGYFEEGNFWTKTIDDLHQMNGIIRNGHPGLPLFLFGHSMGSMLFRHYLALHGGEIQGVLLSGTGGNPGLLGKVGTMLAAAQSAIKGRKARSQMLNAMAFGAFNNHFKPVRTDFDWLSRDEAEVDKYVADDYCGGVFTAGFFADLLKGVGIINHKSTYQNTPKDLPILLIAGSLDPVGDMSKGVLQTFRAYQNAGLSKVSCKIFPDARHELLNETNRDEVIDYILDWIESQYGANA